MLIETTLNINYQIRHKLEKASVKTGKTHSMLIAIIVKKIGNDHLLYLNDNMRIRYQQREANVQWHHLHVSLIIREYELLQDFRKFFKRSISSLISIAVDKYLDDIVNDCCGLNNNHGFTDNNQFIHYIIIRDVVDKVICWRIYWGLPENIHKLHLNAG